MMPELGRINVFYSYAHKDEPYRERLVEWLSALRDEGVINDWHDRKIMPGSDWNHEIACNLDRSHVVLFLISPAFMQSGYSMGVEVKRAIELHWERQCRIVPVILEPTPQFTGTEFGTFQALPKNAKPISQWTPREAAYADIAEGIRKVCKDIVDWENPYRRATVGDWTETEQIYVAGPLRVEGRVQLRVIAKAHDSVTIHSVATADGQRLEKHLMIPLDGPLDHDDFGSIRSEVVNVIDSFKLERDAGGKPVPAFPHPALEDHLQAFLSQIREPSPGIAPEIASIAQIPRNASFWREETGRGEEKLFVGGTPYYCSWTGTRVTVDTGAERVTAEGRTWRCIDVPLDGIVKRELAMYDQARQLLYRSTDLLTGFGRGHAQLTSTTVEHAAKEGPDAEPGPLFPTPEDDASFDLIAIGYRMQGDEYLRKSDYRQAIDCYTAAIAVDPENAVAFYNRGVARQRRGDQAGGEIDIAAARSINPKIGRQISSE